MTMSVSIGLISQSAPHGTGNGQELLDMALAGGSFGQQISLYFVGDGVFQLLKDQQSEHIEQRNYSKTFAALPFYDIEHVYVCQHSLMQRQLDSDDLCIDAEVVTPAKWAELLNQHQHLINL